MSMTPLYHPLADLAPVIPLISLPALQPLLGTEGTPLQLRFSSIRTYVRRGDYMWYTKFTIFL